jgi:hypothetical protein
MKRRKSPYLKKQDEYDKDYRPLIEHPHAFRKNWPKKKARVNRSERAAVRKLMTSGRFEITSASLKKIKSRHWVRKCGILTLRQRLEFNRRRRANRGSDPQPK